MLPFSACWASPRFNKLLGVKSHIHAIGGAGAPNWISSTKVDHCGPVNDPFVRRSAIWFLVPTNLMAIPVSFLKHSDTKSRSTRWVLPTYLKFVLRPLMVILITASLSSMINNLAFPGLGKVCGKKSINSDRFSVFGLARWFRSCSLPLF
jgi:hypothetical protein